MKRILENLILLLVSQVAYGQWQLIDDFQQIQPETILLDAKEYGWNLSTEDSRLPEYWIMPDYLKEGNTSMYFYSGVSTVPKTTWFIKALPENGIPPDETGTLFLRLIWCGVELRSWSIGTTDKSTELNPETGQVTSPGSWDDFNLNVRVGEAYNIEHRDGDVYVSTNPPEVLNRQCWYNFWLVIRNSWDHSTTPPISTGSYNLYAQGLGIGDGYSPTLIKVGTKPQKEAASLRRVPKNEQGEPMPIISFMYAGTTSQPSSVSAGSCVLVDDIYFSEGENISYPISPDWEDIDTGNWLGWINASEAPFLFLYSFDGWIYMKDFPTISSGAWAYFYK